MTPFVLTNIDAPPAYRHFHNNPNILHLINIIRINIKGI